MDTAIRIGKTNLQAGAATEQAPLPTTTRATRQSTKERLLNGKERGLQGITNRT